MSLLIWQLGFPYELFVELYCYDKVKLFPFGLANIGNRYLSCFCITLIGIIVISDLTALVRGNEIMSSLILCFLKLYISCDDVL